MTANYVLLEKITVGAAGASSVTFSSIPQTGYTDLLVKISARDSIASTRTVAAVTFNSSTANYSSKVLYGVNGSFVGSENGASSSTGWTYVTGNTATASTFSNTELYIPNYTTSNYKSVSNDATAETNSGSAGVTSIAASLWSDTAAITSITFTASASATFMQNSTFYLYGVAKLGTTPAIVPYATGGDTIMTDGTYWYHTFISSGTFTPQKALSVDYLVVAGGGGGGSYAGGGAGAGGLRSTVTATGGGGSLESRLSLGTSPVTVTIGAGGAGSTSTVLGASGSNSVFSTITSTGGGRAGDGALSDPALTGGSGGGGAGFGGAGATGAAGTTNQGFAGGNGTDPSASPYAAGGGGGAGAIGANRSGNTAGNGGTGVATSITGSSVTYAGGGGGGVYFANTAGTGGAGGGGAGGANGATGTAGTVNTGGGGGGGGSNGTNAPAGGNGGSGIVIVRYAV